MPASPRTIDARLALDPIVLPRLADLFLDMMAAERGAAKNTLAAYTRDLGDYLAFLGAKRSTPTRCRRRDGARPIWRSSRRAWPEELLGRTPPVRRAPVP